MREELRRREAREREAASASTSNAAEVDKPDEEKKEETPKTTAVPPPTTSFALDRDGLCVVCQDEEANIAIVDCGYVPIPRQTSISGSL